MATNNFENIKCSNLVSNDTTANIYDSNVTTLNLASSATVNIGDSSYVNTSSTSSNPEGNKINSSCPLTLPALTSSGWDNSGQASLTGFAVQTLSLATSGAYSALPMTFYAVKLGGTVNLYWDDFSFTSGASTTLNVTLPAEISPKFDFQMLYLSTVGAAYAASRLTLNASTNQIVFRVNLSGTFTNTALCTIEANSITYPTDDVNWGT